MVFLDLASGHDFKFFPTNIQILLETIDRLGIKMNTFEFKEVQYPHRCTGSLKRIFIFKMNLRKEALIHVYGYMVFKILVHALF